MCSRIYIYIYVCVCVCVRVCVLSKPKAIPSYFKLFLLAHSNDYLTITTIVLFRGSQLYWCVI